MEERMEVLKFLLILTVTVHLSSAVPQSLQYFYTGVSPGINCPEFFAEGRINGEQFEYIDSNIRKFIPKTEWMKKTFSEDSQHWNEETARLHYYQKTFNVNVSMLMQLFNQTKGVHTVQVMYGCELKDGGTKSGFCQVGYDGEDFMFLDVNAPAWVADSPQPKLLKQMWDKNAPSVLAALKRYLETECINWAQQFVNYGRSSLERKVPPEVSVFQRDSSSPVVCHATGFFPSAVMISWKKNGEDVYEDVELRETLPNQDGTFQKRSILTVSPEELNKHNYTCVVQHSSLEGELVRKVEPDGGMGGLIVGAVVAVLLLVLIAACVGVVVWKKKKSGFKSVPVNPNGSTDGENSSTHS